MTHTNGKLPAMEIWIVLGILALWLVLQVWILPALGVPT